MPEQVKKILDRMVEWWKKFNTKQKALLISLTSAVILALVILAVVVSRPTYTTLIDCENTKQASQVKELLDGDGTIRYRVTGSTHFEVNTEDESAANMLLGSNDIATAGYDLEQADINSVVDGSFSRTEADKQKLNKKYLETKMAEDLAANNLIASAKVSLDIPKDDGTLIAQVKESSASVSLALTGDMSDEQAYSIARFIATALGNDSTEKVTILDQKTSKILYSGADQDSETGMLSSKLDAKQKTQSMIKKEVKDVLVQSGLYSDVQVGLNLDMNFDKVEIAEHDYSHNEGQDQGELLSKSEYYAEATGGQAAVPGTDTNDDTPTYLTEDGEPASSSVSDVDSNYAPNEKVTKTTKDGGDINYETSSIAVTATRWIVYNEDELKKSGQLKGTTFAEFKAAHSDPVQVQVTDEDLNLIAQATGFSTNKISFVCYERPQFVESSGKGFGVTDILQILLAVLIFALLGYVVFRSTRKQQEEEELEPELSVESLLESTAAKDADDLENIGYTEKSETRVMIEKFVDENPGAAALLLRNWLNEDWD